MAGLNHRTVTRRSRGGGHDRNAITNVHFRSRLGTVTATPQEPSDLLETRLQPPTWKSPLLTRKALESIRPDIRKARLTLVQAPAGYGKTGLLLEWFRQLETAGATWLTARPDIVSASQMAHYVAACSAAAGAEGPDARRSPPPTEITDPPRLAQWLNGQCDAWPRYFFVDQADMLGPEATRLLSVLIEEAPAEMRFIIACRAETDLHLARLEVRGELVRVGVQLLSLSEAEALSLRAHRTNVFPAQWRLAHRSTKGWPGGLMLLALPGDAGEIMLERYFNEEIYSSLSDEQRAFLQSISILEEISAPLCTTVSGRADANELLAQLVRLALFIEPVDRSRGWFRLHPLFACFLRRKLETIGAASVTDLHRRASQWLAQADQTAAALHHAALAEDPDWLAALLEAECEPLALEGKIALVERYADTLPPNRLLLYPRLTTALAWLRTRSLRLDESRSLLASARRGVEELGRRGGIDASQLEQLQLHCLHQELMCAGAEEQLDRVEILANQILAANTSKPFMVFSAFAQLLSARRERYRLADIEVLVADARSALQRNGYRTARTTIASAAGSALIAAGRIDRGIALLEEGLSNAADVTGAASGLAAIAALPLSEILYERNQLDRARSLVERHLPLAKGFGFLDHLVPGHLTLARLDEERDGVRAAIQALESSMAVARETKLRRFKLAVGAELLRCYGQIDRRPAAFGIARELEIPDSIAASMPTAHSSKVEELGAFGRFHLAMMNGETSEAVRLAKAWSRHTAQRCAPRTALLWQLASVEAQLRLGLRQPAMRALREAIRLAEPMGAIRPFVDCGPNVHELLRSLGKETVDPWSAVDGFALSLCEALPDDAGNAQPESGGHELDEPINNREAEILAHAACGCSNREIGERLGLTEGTVKWYLQQIYDKLGVRRRSQAVLRARSAGYI